MSFEILSKPKYPSPRKVCQVLLSPTCFSGAFDLASRTGPLLYRDRESWYLTPTLDDVVAESC